MQKCLDAASCITKPTQLTLPLHTRYDTEADTQNDVDTCEVDSSSAAIRCLAAPKHTSSVSVTNHQQQAAHTWWLDAGLQV
jgi:hypothetical protein